MPLQTRQPTGAVSHPLVLLEGEEKAGKTYAALALTGSPRVGRSFVLDLGEGTADEYAALGQYEVIEHDGSYTAIHEAITEVRELGRAALAAGEPPIVLVIDSVTALWNGLKDWTNARAAKSEKNKALLREDPHAELNVGMNLWNDAGARHRRIMTMLMTFPGVVVLTARGKEVTSLDEAGRPVVVRGVTQREWKVDAHKDVPFDVSLWVRLRRKSPAEVIGVRSLALGIRPGKDEPQTLGEDWNLDHLLFDVIGYAPGSAAVRDVRAVDGGPVDATEWAEQLRAAWDDVVALRRLYDVARSANMLEVVGRFVAEAADELPLHQVIVTRGRQLEAAAAQAAQESAPESAPEGSGAPVPA